MYRKFFSILHSVGAPLKVKTFIVFTNTIDYLGHIIRPRRLELVSHATDATRELQ